MFTGIPRFYILFWDFFLLVTKPLWGWCKPWYCVLSDSAKPKDSIFSFENQADTAFRLRGAVFAGANQSWRVLPGIRFSDWETAAGVSATMHIPANTTYSSNVDLMMGQRRRLWLTLVTWYIIVVDNVPICTADTSCFPTQFSDFKYTNILNYSI